MEDTRPKLEQLGKTDNKREEGGQIEIRSHELR